MRRYLLQKSILPPIHSFPPRRVHRRYGNLPAPFRQNAEPRQFRLFPASAEALHHLQALRRDFAHAPAFQRVQLLLGLREGCAAWKPVSSSIPPWPLYSPSSGVSSIVQGQSIVRSLHSKRLAVVRIASGLLSTPTKRQPSDCAASIAVPLPQHKSATMSPSRTTGSSSRSSSFRGFCVG